MGEAVFGAVDCCAIELTLVSKAIIEDKSAAGSNRYATREREEALAEDFKEGVLVSADPYPRLDVG
jgi:hypothetical protein